LLRLAAALVLCAMAAAGCGLGPGEETGTIDLTVTRDYGREELIEGTEETNASDTVLRVLDRRADVETRYGGGFVQSIDGLAGGFEGDRRFDWFFYVNGVESSVGSAEFDLSGGDRVWWDYRDWTSAMRVPAVVGSYPEPFVHGFQGDEWPVQVVCFLGTDLCDPVTRELTDVGAEPLPRSARDDVEPGESTRVLVGTWSQLRLDEAAELLALGPSRSGVFARFDGRGRAALVVLDETGGEVTRERAGWGLIAALRPGDGPPTWVVTGTDSAGVRAAMGAFGPEQLRDHYAIAVPEGNREVIPLP